MRPGSIEYAVQSVFNPADRDGISAAILNLITLPYKMSCDRVLPAQFIAPADYPVSPQLQVPWWLLFIDAVSIFNVERSLNKWLVGI